MVDTSRFVMGYIPTISFQPAKSRFHTLAFKNFIYLILQSTLLALSPLTPCPRPPGLLIGFWNDPRSPVFLHLISTDQPPLTGLPILCPAPADPS